MRQHFEHLAAALALLAFALFISYFHSSSPASLSSSARPAHTLSRVASDTAATSSVPSFALSSTTLEALFPTVHPTTTKQAAPAASPRTPQAVPAKPVVAPPAPKPAPLVASTTPATASSSQADQADTGELAMLGKAIVNIICVSHVNGLHSVSGSGVFIDSQGVILTVAHVAQSVLLQEYLGKGKVSCVVRTGNPARTAYLVRPVYVSDAWVKENATTLISSQPLGTGEHDYALLAVTGSATGTALPGAFPAIPITTTAAHAGDPVFIGSYGAQDLTGAQVQNGLAPTLVSSTVKDRYTFGGNTPDVVAINGSTASQEGSSGGAVVNPDGYLIGLITTSEISGSYSSREMRTITPAYIERSYASDTGKDFMSYFGDTGITTLVNVYAPTAQVEGAYIANAIGLTQ